MKNEIISRLKAAGTLVQQGKLYQRATTGWRIIFKNLQWSSERMQSHKHCSKYHSNNPTHPLSAAIESPRWPPRKSHAQKKQNGRSYSWFWWLCIEKKKRAKSRLQSLNSQGKDRLSLTTAESLCQDSLGWLNTNPGLGQIVAGFLHLPTCLQHTSALAVPSALARGVSIHLASLQPPTSKRH